MFDEILASIALVSADFENGLTGIGWATNYLMENKFVDGEPNEVLQNVDSRIFSQITGTPSYSVFGQGLYFLARMSTNITGQNEKLHKLLDYCCSQIEKDKSRFNLCYLNSLLYCIICIDNLKLYVKNRNFIRLKTSITDIAEEVMNGKYFENNDLFVLNNILTFINPEHKRKWTKLLALKNHIHSEIKSYNNDVNDFIVQTWQNTVYFKNTQNTVIELPSNDIIYKFVEEKQETLTVNDILLNQGLAGLGFALLKNIYR
ncbi:MAG: hypothetical protein LBG92_09555 [Prevotellaceae bacterium]|nr:hypothetical protein [Prevotellaceae bacterium]